MAEFRATWYAASRWRLPPESDSHKVRGEGINLSAGICILLLLAGPPTSQKKTTLYQLQENLCLKQTLCALIQLKPQAQCSGAANNPSVTIPSEDTQHLVFSMYFTKA